MAIAIASPALAADQAQPAAASTADAAAADAAVDATLADAGPGLGEIVVTATKRETNLQKTPIAINVVSASMIADRHVQSLYDLADGSVPSLRIATFEARQTALTIGIRGIVPLDANQPAREQGVGVYIDGVYLGRQHGLNAALFDVDRIEVLKGPQGTLFGRNSEGGALSIVTKNPSGEFGGRITAGIANYGGYNGDIHIDLPAYHNISLKFDGVVQHQDATIKDPLAGSTGWNFFDRRGGRVSARWKPTPEFTADVSYDFGYDANTPFYSQLLNYNPNGCIAGPATAACTLPGTKPTTFTGTIKPLSPLVVIQNTGRATVADIGVPQQPSIDNTHGVTAHLSYKITPSIELRSITAYRTVRSTQYDNSGGAHRVPAIALGCVGTACNFSRYSVADLAQHQFSQEFQVVGSLPQVDYVAGLYYFNETANDDAATPSTLAFNSTLTAVTVLDPCTGSAGFGYQIGCRSIDRASIAYDKSYAAFGQATFSPDFVPGLHVTVGGRYTKDDKHGALFTVNNAPRPFTFAQKTSRFNPLAIIAYDAAPGVNVYAKYSSGYRAGGASSRSVTYRSFGPEDVKAYEVGLKSEFLDHRVRLNLAGYIMDRKGSQIDFSTTSADPITGTNRNTIETINATGITRIRGFEADLTVNPATGLTLTGSYAYTYTKVPDSPNPNSGIVQQVFIVFTPRNAASGSLDYSLPFDSAGSKVKLHLDANYAQATQAFDTYATKADSSFIVNGRLSLADVEMGRGNSKLTIAAWVRNMFDYAYVYRRDPSNSLAAIPAALSAPGVTPIVFGPNANIGNILGDYGNYNAPRTFGLEARITF